MEFLIQSAWAQSAGATGAPAGPGLSSMILPLVFIAAIYFLLFRPQAKRAKEHQALVAGLKKGDEVTTAGGILGRITAVDEQFITLKISNNTEIQVQRHHISQILPKGSMKG